MHTLYPAIKPYSISELVVSPRHKLYVEQCGNPHGQPVIVLHSGPGVGCESIQRRFFSPDKYRIILFDQRGSGRSTPHASTEDNATLQLLEDLEKIRHELNISKCVLFGHGWGTTLALLYAQAFTQHISGLILAGTWLSEAENKHWLYQGGAGGIFPDYWHDFVSYIAEDERQDLIEAYRKRLTDTNELAQLNAAKHWVKWRVSCSTLQPNFELMTKFCEPHTALSTAIIETHFLKHDFFLKDTSCIDNIHRLRHLPMFIIHGRYDCVSPLSQAWRLHRCCPASELIVVRDAGHAIREPGIIDAIVNAGHHLLNIQPSIC